MAWPPPYLYGLPTILLAAAIAAWTSAGASSGAYASPSSPMTARGAATVWAAFAVFFLAGSPKPAPPVD